MVHAEDWPQFRGPDGQGHSDAHGLPTEWGETRNITWKVPVPGRGWSSPVVADARVWLTTATQAGREGSLRLLAFDVASGRPILDVELFRLRNSALLNP
ncbi:MAG: PQQ-binding-like beta-propeller repeat protein, partial [Acidobacteria bacterium]|nr:PQQ-binding-like beta-propeller repeat protein [Acidobacteriota bacterium]